MSQTVVLKFGGASVATPQSFDHIARIIINKKKKFYRIVVVVSAMGNTTDELLKLAHEVNANPPSRELDMLVSVGERISTSLLAMALAKYDIEALSFTGSQSGILTTNDHAEARIIDVKPRRLLPCLNLGQIVIVAGFQGMSLDGNITTLGRGGSDTTAVALAVALQASHVEFYKDVYGIYDKDPKKFDDSDFYPTLNYEETLAIVEKGARVLHPRCVSMARKNNLPLHVLNFQEYEMPGTWITSSEPQSNKLIYEN